jgi:hypothetical protein
VIIGTSTLLAACGNGDSNPTPTVVPATTVANEATETAVPQTSIGEIVWTTEVDPAINTPLDPVESFTTDAGAVYAVVRVENLRQGSVLSAAWTYNDAPLDGAGQTITPSQDYPAGFVEFHLVRSDEQLWPTGSYQLTITLDGQIVQRAVVDVES